MVTAVESRFAVEVSDDRMHAFVKCTKRGGYDSVQPGEIVAILEAAGVEAGDDVTQKLHEFVELINKSGPPSTPFEIATGKPSAEGKDAQLTWDKKFEDNRPKQWHIESDPGFFLVQSYTIFDEGDVLGKLAPMEQGHEGVDVAGDPIPRRHVPQDLSLGVGLKLAEDGESVVAQGKGRLEIIEQVMSLFDCQVIEGEVTSKESPLTSAHALFIKGGIANNAEVHCDRSMTVAGSIEAAKVEAKGHLAVGESICGSNKAEISAAGNIVARFCENATLKAEGDVRMFTAVTNCTIHAMGRLDVAGGVIVGGSAYARGGVAVKTLGNEAGVKTVVRVGPHPDLLSLLAQKNEEIIGRRKAAERIRQTVTPLMAQMKRLSAQQRERATELLYQADELEQQIADIEEEIKKVDGSADLDEDPTIDIEGRVCEGTTIFIREYKVIFDRELRGPVRISLEDSKGRFHVVAHNKVTNTQKILTSKKLSLAELRKQ